MNRNLRLMIVFLLLVPGRILAQADQQNNNQVRFNLSADGKQYIRFTFLNQVWVRYTNLNPGSQVNGYDRSEIFDIGLRRTRMQLFGQISPRVYFYTQFGMNNFSYLSKQFSGAFFHDALAEFQVHENALSIGGGLTGWSGLSRYASPSVGTILSLDAPLYQQATNGVNDQFLRKLSIYAKGKLGRLDYRVALTRPMEVVNAVAPVSGLSPISDFSPVTGKLQSQVYFMYQFLDQEDNTNPYTVGTYLGKKRIFNIGFGKIYQPEAMWYHTAAMDTVMAPLLLLGADMFCELPLSEERSNTLTAYLAYNHFDFGPGYIRNLGVMNPANGVNALGTFNGAGNAAPLIGTGNTVYLQLGYLFRRELIGSGTIQVYAASQYSAYERLDDPVLVWETGLNWLIEGDHGSKLSFNYQDRPVFRTQPSGVVSAATRRGMIQVQYQVSF